MSKVLIVDDERNIRNIVERLLDRQGFECRQAGDAREAADVMEHDRFDVVLCDVHMPGMSGVDLAGEIRRRFPETAVVMVTGEDSTAFASIAQENGAAAYVLKPFRTAELLIAVCGALRRRQTDIDTRRRQATSERALSRAAAQIGAAPGRVGRVCGLVARALGWTPDRCDLIRHAAPLKDVGLPGTGSPLLEMAAAIARTHAAPFDGPAEGQSEEGSIFAVADAYEALRRSQGHLETLETLRARRGTLYDPDVLDAFLTMGEQVETFYEAD